MAIAGPTIGMSASESKTLPPHSAERRALPRFFFHIEDGKSIRDHKGEELPDWDTARLYAITVAGRIIADEPQRLGLGEDWVMEVTDEHELVLFRIDFHITASPTVRENLLRPKGKHSDRS